HTHAHRAPAAPRLLLPRARAAARGRARERVRRLHPALQRHRAAGGLAAAALDRGRPARRRPSGGGLGARGSAHPRRGAARAGPTLGRSTAARARHCLSEVPMARLPYVDPASAPEAVRATFERLPVSLNVFRMMAHAETGFRPLVLLGTTILGQQQLSPKLRELVILHVAT